LAWVALRPRWRSAIISPGVTAGRGAGLHRSRRRVSNLCPRLARRLKSGGSTGGPFVVVVYGIVASMGCRAVLCNRGSAAYFHFVGRASASRHGPAPVFTNSFPGGPWSLGLPTNRAADFRSTQIDDFFGLRSTKNPWTNFWARIGKKHSRGIPPPHLSGGRPQLACARLAIIHHGDFEINLPAFPATSFRAVARKNDDCG